MGSANLSIMCPRAVRIQDTTLIVDVPGIKQLVKPVSRFPSIHHISLHRVEIANPFGKRDMAGVVEPCIAEHTDAILCSGECSKLVY